MRISTQNGFFGRARGNVGVVTAAALPWLFVALVLIPSDSGSIADWVFLTLYPIIAVLIWNDWQLLFWLLRRARKLAALIMPRTP